MLFLTFSFWGKEKVRPKENPNVNKTVIRAAVHPKLPACVQIKRDVRVILCEAKNYV